MTADPIVIGDFDAIGMLLFSSASFVGAAVYVFRFGNRSPKALSTTILLCSFYPGFFIFSFIVTAIN